MKSNAHLPSTLRLCVIIAGYLIAIAGALSMLSDPWYIAPLGMVMGLGVSAMGAGREYAAPRHTRRSVLVWIAGCAVILGVLWLIGEDRVRHWTPHPAGYQLAWFFGLEMCRHLRQILRHGLAPAHE